MAAKQQLVGSVQRVNFGVKARVQTRKQSQVPAESKSTKDMFIEYADVLGTDNMPSLTEFTAMREQGGKAWNELTQKVAFKQALDGGSISPFTRFAEYKNAVDYIANSAPNVVALYGNDVNAAVGAVLQQMAETNVSVEDAVAQVMKRDGGDRRNTEVEGTGESNLQTRVIDEKLDTRLIQRVKEIRASFTGLFKRGNFGYSEVNIEGLELSELYAHSKIMNYEQIKDKQFASNIRDISRKYSYEESLFKPLYVDKNQVVDGPDAFLRNVDTEAKMLEDLARRLGSNKMAKGTIKLYTELPPCPSCSRVTELFNKKYPDIIIEVIHGSGTRLTF